MCFHRKGLWKMGIFLSGGMPAAFLKNIFEKGIDFMEKWRYNAYLYEKLS